MLAIIPTRVRSIPQRWRQQVAERRLLTAVDPAADALERAAKELEREIEAADDEGRVLSTAEYAALRKVAIGTVRKWCARGELAGATRTGSGDWAIPSTAVRRRARRAS